MHTYYIKQDDINTMIIPKQASWIIRKIINSREDYLQMEMQRDRYTIGKGYRSIRSDIMKVDWRIKVDV